MQPIAFQFQVRHMQDLTLQERNQHLGLFRGTRSCSTSKLPEGLREQRYVANFSSAIHRVMTVHVGGVLQASLLEQRLAEGDCRVTAVCATQRAACMFLLRSATEFICGYGPRRILAAVAPEARIANVLFGLFGFVSNGMRERDSVMMLELERSPTRPAREQNEIARSGVEHASTSEYEEGPEYAFAMCQPESAQYGLDLAAMVELTKPLFEKGLTLIRYDNRSQEGSVRCGFGTARAPREPRWRW